MPPLHRRTSAANTDLTIVLASVLSITAIVAIIFTHFYLRRRRRTRNLQIRSRTPRTHRASIPSDKPSRWHLGKSAAATEAAARRLSTMTCRSASITVESLRRVAREKVRLKAKVSEIRAGNITISPPRDARTEDGVRLSKFPYGLDAPLPPPPSAQNIGRVQRDGEGYGLGHGLRKKAVPLPNNRHVIVGDNASDVHPLYRGSLEQRRGSPAHHPHARMPIQKATPGRLSPRPAGHGYEYAYLDDEGNAGFLQDWHPNLSPLHEDSQLQQLHEDRVNFSPSPHHSQPQAVSPAEITEHRDLIERLHRFGLASSRSPSPSSSSQPVQIQKPLPAALQNLKLEEGPAEKRTDPETPRTAASSSRRREAERIARARYMRSFSPSFKSDDQRTGEEGDEGGTFGARPETRKLRHRSSDTDVTGSLYSRFSRHRQGPIQRDLGRDLRDRREWKWEWELEEDRNLDVDQDSDLEKGVVVLPQVEEDGSLSDPRPDGPFPPRRASLGFGFESVGADGKAVDVPRQSPSPWSLRREKEKLRRVAESREKGDEENECWATRTLKKKRGKGDFKNHDAIGEQGGVRDEKGVEEDGLREYLALVGKDTGYEGQRVEQKWKDSLINKKNPLLLPDRFENATTPTLTAPGVDPETDATTSDADTKSLAAFTHPSIAPQPLVVRKIPSNPPTLNVQHAVEYRSPPSSPYNRTRSWEAIGHRRARSPEMMLNGSSAFSTSPEQGQGSDFLLDPTWDIRTTSTHTTDRNRDVSPESQTERHSADHLVEGLAGLGVKMERTANGLLTSKSGVEHEVGPTGSYSDGSSSSLGLPLQSPDTSPDAGQGGLEDKYEDEGGDDYHAFMRDINNASTLYPPYLPRTRYGESPISQSTISPSSRFRQDTYNYKSEARPITAMKGTPPYPQPISPPQISPHPQAQGLQLHIPTVSSPPLGYRIDPNTGMEIEGPLDRGSLAQSTWEADLLSSYTTAPPLPTPAQNPIPFPHERGPAPAPPSFQFSPTGEHTHVMPGSSPGVLRRAMAMEQQSKAEARQNEKGGDVTGRGIGRGENGDRQKVRLGLMTGTVEEGGRGWL